MSALVRYYLICILSEENIVFGDVSLRFKATDVRRRATITLSRNGKDGRRGSRMG